MKSTIVNTSKEMMAYSDFLPLPEWPNFMHNTLVQQYLKMYAKNFNLLKYIQFNTEVEQVKLNFFFLINYLILYFVMHVLGKIRFIN